MPADLYSPFSNTVQIHAVETFSSSRLALRFFTGFRRESRYTGGSKLLLVVGVATLLLEQYSKAYKSSVKHSKAQ